MAALKQPTIKVVAIIAEGVPESDTKQLIAFAKANNKVTSIGVSWVTISTLSYNISFASSHMNMCYL